MRLIKILAVFPVALISYIILFPQLFRCQIIGISDFRALSDHIFLAPQIPLAHHRWVLGEIAKAQSRIDSMYQGRKGRPTYIVCSNPDQYETYCNSTEGAGCSLGTPWGSSYVVVNLNGVNTDVISHELSHVELLAQLGWWSVTFNIPQWFNEGLALMADRRFVSETDPSGRYLGYMDEWLYQTGGGQIILELREIETLRRFFGGNSRHVMTAYMTAGLEISYWMTSHNRNQLRAFLDKIRSGSSFESAYTAAGKSHFIENLPPNPLRPDTYRPAK